MYGAGLSVLLHISFQAEHSVNVEFGKNWEGNDRTRRTSSAGPARIWCVQTVLSLLEEVTSSTLNLKVKRVYNLQPIVTC